MSAGYIAKGIDSVCCSATSAGSSLRHSKITRHSVLSWVVEVELA